MIKHCPACNRDTDHQSWTVGGIKFDECLECDRQKSKLRPQHSQFTLRGQIDGYYQARELVQPDARQALLWLLSEVGELAEAYLSAHRDELSALDIYVLGKASDMGVYAEDDVTSDNAAWVRNNDRARPHNIADEIGDAVMMLDRVALALGMAEPEELLKQKMKRKGFDPGVWRNE